MNEPIPRPIKLPIERPRHGADAVAAISSLGEPTRRALYDFVVASADWVSRDRAAEAVGIERGTAAHHLDRLAADGLLDVDYQRLSGRQGPGAGRPASSTGGPAARSTSRCRVATTCSPVACSPTLPTGRDARDRHPDGPRRCRGRPGPPARRRDPDPVQRWWSTEWDAACGAPSARSPRFRADLQRRWRRRVAELPVPPARPRAHRADLRHEPLHVGRCRRGPRRRRARAGLEPEEGVCCVRLHPVR